MKNLVKTTLSSILAGAIIVTTLTACNNEPKKDGETTTAAGTDVSNLGYTPDANTPAWQLDKSTGHTIKWYVNADWWNSDFGNDTVTKIMKEELNVNIEFITGDDTKLNSLFSAGTLPDMVTIFDSQSQLAKKAATWALPLNDLADKYDPNFYKAISQETFDWYKLADGKTYGYPSYSNTSADYEAGYLNGGDCFVVREDVYKAIGSPDMTTEESFMAGLKLMKEKYPDLIPFGMRSFAGGTGTTGSIAAPLQNYLGIPVSNADNTYYDRNLDPEYLRWVKIFNKSYKEGYISDDAFSDDNTAYEEKVTSGKYASMFISGAPQLGGVLQANYTADHARKYIAVNGPTNANGNAPTIGQAGISGWTVTYITKDCKDLAKAIQLYTYLISDHGREVCFFGKEGETFSVNADGKYEFLPEVQKEKEENPENFKKVYRFGEFCLFGHDGYNIAHGAAAEREALVQIYEWCSGKVKPQFIIENINPEAGTVEARNLTNINAQWATTLATLLRSKDDAEFDKTVNDYKKFLTDTGFDAIVKVYNEKMAINADRLNLK